MKRGEVRRRAPIAIRRAKQRRGPERSPLYLAWIRRLHCAVCRRPGTGLPPNEAAHTNVLGAAGLGQKTSDFSAIPLCFAHHRGEGDSYHRLGERAFARRHRLDLPELVRTLNEIYSHQAVSSSVAEVWREDAG